MLGGRRHRPGRLAARAALAVTVAAAAVVVVGGCRTPAPRGSWFDEDLGHVHHTRRRVDPDARQQAATRLRAALADDRPGDVVVAAAELVAAGGELGDDATAVVAAVDRAAAADLERAGAAMATDRAPAGVIAARLAAVALHAGDRAGAESWLAVARAAPDAASAATLIDAVAGRLAATAAVDPAVIAVLLPRTGRFAALGAELEAAIELVPAGGARRLYLDTGGDADRAAAAVDRAAAAGAIAVLGPVGVREADAAALRAVALGLPIALLAPGDGADPAAGVFRLVDSPESEARAAAAIAATLGEPTAGVLAPRDEVGTAAAEAFAAAAEAAGLTVTARGSYDPTASDLQPDVKEFLGLDPATNPRLAAHLRRHGKRGWQTFSPDVPFSLLYLPDRHDRAALVASFLPYLGVELRTADFLDPDYLRRKHRGRIPQVVQLLGSSAWHHPSLAARGGPALEGAYFVEPCPGALGDPSAADMVAAFRARTGREPSAGAQEAHDAWRMVAAARAAAAGAADPRAAFAAALGRARVDDGACAPARVGPDGQVVREPALLGVDAGEIVAVPY